MAPAHLEAQGSVGNAGAWVRFQNRRRVPATFQMLLWSGLMNMLRYIAPGGATLIGAMLIGMIVLAIATWQLDLVLWSGSYTRP